MKKIFLFKHLAKALLALFLLCSPVLAKVTYVSIVPSVTELIYALNLQDGLVGVSDRCNYPADTKNKEKIGSLYGVNKEKILKIRPTYTFALDTSAPFLLELKGATKLVYFKFDSVEDIFSAIHTLGNLFGVQKRSDALVANIQKEIKPSVNKKTILYVIQSEPLITIGKNSYLTDVIRLSGNVSATSNVDGYYPSLSKEYIIKLRPDYVVVGPYASISALKPILKNSKFVTMTKEQNDIINRPAARIGSAVGFFSQLK